MTITDLSTVVSVLAALSVASERLVEIIKGLVPFLNQENTDATKEGWRRALLQALAVVAGIVTALLAKDFIKGAVGDVWSNFPQILVIGFLASGGSGFWNSILTFVNKVKDLKKLEAEEKKALINRKEFSVMQQIKDGRLEVAIAVHQVSPDLVKVDQTKVPWTTIPPNLFDLTFNDNEVRIDDIRMPQFRGNLVILLPEITDDINQIDDNANQIIGDVAEFVRQALLSVNKG